MKNIIILLIVLLSCNKMNKPIQTPSNKLIEVRYKAIDIITADTIGLKTAYDLYDFIYAEPISNCKVNPLSCTITFNYLPNANFGIDVSDKQSVYELRQTIERAALFYFSSIDPTITNVNLLNGTSLYIESSNTSIYKPLQNTTVELFFNCQQ